MKQFFKFMFASFLGTLLTIIIGILIFSALIASLAALSEKQSAKVEPNSILRINWHTAINDRANDNPFENFDFANMQSNKPNGLNVILKTLDKAGQDPNIDGIFLDMETIPAGLATSEEIRNKLLEVKEKGKFIVSYGNGYDQKAYYLASVADEIYLNPEGMILFKGLHAQVVFLKGLLDKLEIDMQVVRGPNNKYKSAVEPLMLEKISEANRQQLSDLLNSMWGRVLMAMSESRGIGIDDLNHIADKLDVSTAEKALELKFVDGLLYRDELMELLKKKVGKEADDKLETVSFGSYINTKLTLPANTSKNRVAVVYAEGSIVQGKGQANEIGSESLSKAISKARKNEKVKAIVMRVNSPGGDALASEVIRREVELAKKEKPFIISMGNVAASGGYWISTDADYIFAQPTTITGSIGVFGIIPNFHDFFKNKFGIRFDDVMTNKNSNFIDVMKPMDPYHHEILNKSVIDIYEKFTALVARSRNLEISYVDSIGRGRVWSGADARSIGLVDELGGLDMAIAYAAEKAELGDDFKLIEYPIQKEFIEQLKEELTGKTTARIVRNELGAFANYYDQIKSMQDMKGVQARLPFFYTLN